MKHTISFLIGLIFTITSNAQVQDLCFTSKLNSGCPKDIEPIKNQLGMKNFSYALFETGVDSLKVIFGEMTQGETSGYWISHYSNNVLNSFKTITLEKKESSESLSKKIDIEFDNSSKRISLRVKHNPSSDEVSYAWLNNNEKSKTLKIANIERPIQKNKKFPSVKLESLNGESLTVQDFEGKYVILNWWATTCAPCRKEIPGLNKLVKKYKTNKNVVFLSIAFDKKERLENYLKYNEFMYLQTLGNKNTSEIFGESFPKNIIINPEGIVTYYSEGGHENKHIEIEEELKRQMNKK